jgi:hypothetical protein
MPTLNLGWVVLPSPRRSETALRALLHGAPEWRGLCLGLRTRLDITDLEERWWKWLYHLGGFPETGASPFPSQDVQLYVLIGQCFVDRLYCDL